MIVRVCIAAGLLMLLGIGAPQGPLRTKQQLFTADDQLLIAQARARKDTTIAYQLLTAPANTQRLVSDVERLGGSVSFEAAELGYVHAVVPIGQLDRLVALPEIQLMNVLPAEGNPALESTSPRQLESTGDPVSESIGAPRLDANTPYDTPFTGTTDIGATAFMRRHPTFDGRGVTIGFVELFDPTHPALQSARTLAGNPVPKAVDFRVCCASTYTSSSSLGWVDMRQNVEAANGSFSYLGHTFTAPHDGPFHVGLYHAKDLTNTRSGQRAPFLDATTFPVLWDAQSGDVWVDADQDASFTDEKPMRDFHVNHDIGMLPLISAHDKNHWPKGITRPEAIPFVVQTDARANRIALILPWNRSHGSMTTTSAAGNGFFGGAAGGVAPNARILSIESLGEDIEAVIELARRHVDVISLSGGVFSPDHLGTAVDTALMTRIVDRYGVAVTTSAANEGFMQSADQAENDANNVLVIGGYTSQRVFGATIGVNVPKRDYVVNYSSDGPRFDGMLQPDVVSPTGWLAGDTQYTPPAYLYGKLLLPKGYSIGGGTSQASPTAAGAVALLISAAKQRGIHYTPELLKRVIDESARYLPGTAAYKQGNGLIDVPAAWKMLERTARDTSTVRFSASVHTVDSGQRWGPPASGAGLYEREGWQAGMHGVRVVRFTRLTGPPGNLRYAIRLIGNDGTFTCESQTIVLPLRKTVLVTLDIAPRTEGAHSALLRLVNERTGNAIDTRMLTIVAAAQFTKRDNYHVSTAGAVTQPDSYSYFVHVPPNTDALTVGLSLPKGAIPETVHNFAAQWDILVANLPNGRQPRGGWPQFTMYHSGYVWRHTFVRPMPGVWEIQFNSARIGFWNPPVHAHLSRVPFQLSASVYHVVTLHTKTLPGGALQYTLQNAFAPLHSRAVVVQSATAQNGIATLTSARPRAEIPVTIPKETSEMRVRILSSSVPNADIAIHAFNCAQMQAHYQFGQTGKCTLRAESDMYRGNREATTAMPVGSFSEQPSPPTPGRWIVAFTSDSRVVRPISLRYRIAIISKRQSQRHVAKDTVRNTGAVWSERFAAPPGTCALQHPLVLSQLEAAEAYTIIRNTPFPPDTSGPPIVVQRENPSTKPVLVYTPVWDELSTPACPKR